MFLLIFRQLNYDLHQNDSFARLIHHKTLIREIIQKHTQEKPHSRRIRM